MMPNATQARNGQSEKAEESPRAHRIIGPRQFRATHEIAAAAARLSVHLTDTLNLPPSFAARMDMALFELSDNALHHGHDPENPRAKPTATVTHRPARDTLTIRVTDKGLGIPATLRRGDRKAPKNDPEALLLAMLKGVTATRKANRGQGLHTTMATALCEGNTLSIDSGSAHLTVPPIGPPACLRTRPATGTTAVLTIDLSRGDVPEGMPSK